MCKTVVVVGRRMFIVSHTVDTVHSIVAHYPMGAEACWQRVRMPSRTADRVIAEFRKDAQQ